MPLALKPADLIMIVVVTAQVLTVAYIHAPRAKSMIYMLPLPFSTGLVSTGHGIDTTHMLGMAVVWGFLWLIWLLHTRLRVPIILADLCGIAVYGMAGFALAKVVPAHSGLASPWYWTAASILLVLSLLALRLRHPQEPGHRSAMPLPLKGALVVLVILVLIGVRSSLRGFMPTFPLATIFTVYEARHSLRTLAQRIPIFIAGFTFMATVIAWLLPVQTPIAPVDYVLPLLCGWAVFIPVYLGLDFWYARQHASPRLGHTQ